MRFEIYYKFLMPNYFSITLYIIGRKDAIQVIAKINEKYHQNVQLEEHYVIASEPGEF